MLGAWEATMIPSPQVGYLQLMYQAGRYVYYKEKQSHERNRSIWRFVSSGHFATVGHDHPGQRLSWRPAECCSLGCQASGEKTGSNGSRKRPRTRATCRYISSIPIMKTTRLTPGDGSRALHLRQHSMNQMNRHATSGNFLRRSTILDGFHRLPRWGLTMPWNTRIQICTLFLAFATGYGPTASRFSKISLLNRARGCLAMALGRLAR